ncbi:MAG: sulfatase-like hydrolase/transferase [Clostridia bacterium]|nr:sulfatase-like hydrolase/transferase [Clostridia bacterium]
MRKYLKEILPAVIVAFISSFMLFIYEPIIMYVSNSTDFWFDIKILISCTSIIFFIAFFAIFIGYNIVYLLTKYVFKEKEKIYRAFLVIGFVLFLVTYIQGNFLAGKLPVLDGSPIEWNNYTTLSVISGLLLIVAFGVAIFMVIKLKMEKCVKIFSYISCAIFFMLSISLVSTCISKGEAIRKKEYITTATARNINKYSSKKNFIIFMLDAIDAETAEGVYQSNEQYQKALKDFTYYPDTVGAYPFTRDSVPLVLSGVWSENKTDFGTFYNDAMDQSRLLNMLNREEYVANIYDDEFAYEREGVKQIQNIDLNNKVDAAKFIKQEIKYDLYKYLPYYLKRYSRIEEMDFKTTRKEDEKAENTFVWDDKIFYNDYLNQDVEITNQNEFKFIHIEGAHHPFNCDKNLNDIENGTYEDKIEASFTIIEKYIGYLKENGVYDNTAIIIMADHGFWFDTDVESLLKRQNPMFYVKGFNETHEERQVSDEKMSFDYLQDLYVALLEGKKTDELFENIDNSGPRRFLLYVISGYDHMVEYMQYGHSKNLETLKETGNVYDR